MPDPEQVSPTESAEASDGRGGTGATTLVFVTSAAVLVIEILAGRLMAPYVGVSLETFTGIIGTVLAGIAIGSWAGGVLSDRHDPRRLIGPSLLLSGITTWSSLPIVDWLGPELGSGPLGIVTLTAASFLVPCAVLSAVSPMVAKLQLRNLSRSGAVIGRLSAAGTVGALAGTFLTGFVLLSVAPTRPTVLVIGALLVIGGAVSSWRSNRGWVRAPMVGIVALTAGAALQAPGPCEHDTAYSCVRVLVDPDDPSRRSLLLDGVRNASVDLDDPTVLDLRYVRLFADVADSMPAGPLTTLHVGGGGFGFHRYLQHVRPGSRDVVLEIDPELVRIAEAELGLVRDDRLDVRHGDARIGVRDLDDATFDLVVGDAFSGVTVPWHLTTSEFIAEVDRTLRDGGIYVMNVIDGRGNDFARAQLATLRRHFTHVAVIVPASGIPTRAAANQVLVASDAPLPALRVAADDGVVLDAAALDRYIGGARPLRDDHAPVDQLLRRGR